RVHLDVTGAARSHRRGHAGEGRARIRGVVEDARAVDEVERAGREGEAVDAALQQVHAVAPAGRLALEPLREVVDGGRQLHGEHLRARALEGKLDLAVAAA